MGFSDFIWDKMNDHMTNDGAYSASNWWIGLSTTTPTAAGDNVTEPSGNGYGRVEIEAADWDASSGEAKLNAEDIAFVEATGSWGEVTHVVLYDAETDGNFLGFGALGSSETITSGQVPRFAAGDLLVGKA